MLNLSSERKLFSNFRLGKVKDISANIVMIGRSEEVGRGPYLKIGIIELVKKLIPIHSSMRVNGSQKSISHFGLIKKIGNSGRDQ